MALLAVSLHGQVGIDVEEPNRHIETDSIVTQFFAPTEQMVYSALPASERAVAFLRCWTRKEAYIKARGEGMGIALDSFSVSLGPQAFLTPVSPDEVWQITDLNLADGYVGALVYEGGPQTVQVGEAVTAQSLYSSQVVRVNSLSR